MYEILTGLMTSLAASLLAFVAGVCWSERHRIVNSLRRRGVALVVGSRGDVTITYSGRGAAGSESNIVRTGDLELLVRISSTAERYRGRGRSRIRIASPITPPAGGSEILIGGPQANPRAKTALRTIMMPGSKKTPLVEVTVSANRYAVKVGGDTYVLRRVNDTIVTDYGVILSTPHPSDNAQRLTLLFGLKSHGTQGAAQFIETKAYANVTRGLKYDATFCVVLKVPVDDGIAGPLAIEKFLK